MLRGMNRQFPPRNQAGWDFSEVCHALSGSKANLLQLQTYLNRFGDGESNKDQMFGDDDINVTKSQGESASVGLFATTGEEELPTVCPSLRNFHMVPYLVHNSGSFEALFTYLQGLLY